MSSADKHNNTWSASDIEKYLRGELPARDMHQLEQAALEDPFLADAIEGMALHPAAAPNQDLAELRTRLEARTTGKKNRPTLLYFRLQLAAAIILLLGLGIIAYYNFLPGSRALMSVAKKEPAPSAAPAASIPESSAASASAKADTAQPAAAVPTIDLARSAPKHKAVKPVLPPPADLAAASATTVPAPTVPAATVPGLAVTSDANAETLTKKMAADRLAFKTTDSTRTVAALQSVVIRGLGNQQRPAGQLVFSGKVLDEHNNPLPGASLVLNGASGDNGYVGNSYLSTVTDRQGQFSLRLRPQDSTRRLTVAMVGYEQTSLALNTLNIDGPQSNIIRLQQQHNSLDEVVVVGYGTQRKETIAMAPSANDERLDSLWQRATPVIGREAYLQYLAAAQKRLSLDSTIRGRETISFEVDKNGALTAFKIEQSLSPAHDAGAIRLVKEGPVWRLLHGRKARAVVSMEF